MSLQSEPWPYSIQLKVVIENYPSDQVELLLAPCHPNKEEMGTRELPFSQTLLIEAEDFKVEANKHFKRLVLGKEVRLRNAYVIKAERVEEDDSGNITTIYCTYDPQTLGKNPADGRKVKGVIHWVSAEHAVKAQVRLYDRLFNVPNPASADDYATVLNPDSLILVQEAALEPSLASAQKEQSFQFERTGYFCRDNKSEALVFNQTVGLRDTWDNK